jgi:hypothetical protein
MAISSRRSMHEDHVATSILVQHRAGVAQADQRTAARVAAQGHYFAVDEGELSLGRGEDDLDAGTAVAGATLARRRGFRQVRRAHWVDENASRRLGMRGAERGDAAGQQALTEKIGSGSHDIYKSALAPESNHFKL